MLSQVPTKPDKSATELLQFGHIFPTPQRHTSFGTDNRLPHFQVDLPSSNSGRAAGILGLVLPDQLFRELPLTRIRRPSSALHSGARRRGTSAGPVAPRVRRERSTMEGAS